MKYSVLDVLACPECGRALKLRVFEVMHLSGERAAGAGFLPCSESCAHHGTDFSLPAVREANPDECLRHEILSGVLECNCGMWFPIIRGIPRLLPEELRTTVLSYYPEFFKKYQSVLPSLGSAEKTQVARALEIQGKKDTIYRFSYEWNEFKDYDDDNFSIGLGPIGNDFLQGKIVLDAGCGAGRHAKAARRHGAREVYAMDLSNSVDAAFENTILDQDIHVIQGDIFHPPFGKAYFDLVYSLWALPHTHDPPTGFHALVPCIRPTGSVVVYLYNSERWLSYRILGLMRQVTTKLPNAAVRGIALALGLIDFALLIQPYNLLRRFTPVRALLEKITPSHVRLYASRSFKTCYTDWMDRLFYPYVHYYSREEAAAWLRKENFAESSVLTLGNYGMIVRGTGPA